MITKTGILRQINALSDTCCDEWLDFECKDGTLIEDVCNDIDAPINLELVIVLDGLKIIDYEVIDELGMMIDAPYKNIALVRPVRKADQITDRLWNELSSMAKAIEQAYSQYTEKFTVKVTPYALVDTHQPYDLSFNFQAPEVLRQMEEQNPEGFDSHNYFCGYGGYRSGLNGIANTGSWKAWVFVGDYYTFLHEIGHNFGLQHSTTEGNEYGGTDWQAKYLGYPNASHQMYLNLVPERGFKDIRESEALCLLPLDCKSVDLRNGEYLVARVFAQLTSNAISGREIVSYISARKTRIQDKYGQPSFQIDKVHIHQSDPPWRSTYRSKDIAVLSEGEEFVIPDTNARVIHQGSKNGVQRVAIVYDSDTIPFPADFPEWDDIPTEPLKDEHSGIWGDSRYKDQGFDIQINKEKEQAIAYWFTYDLDGNPLFYVFDGKVNDGSITGNVIRTKNGNESVIGNGILRFIDDDDGIIRLETSIHGRVHFRLKRFTPPRTGLLSGIWTTGKFEGFSSGIFQNEVNGVIVNSALFYRYNRDGSWLVFSGQLDNEYQIQFDVLRVDNSFFKCIHHGEVVRIGSSTLDIESMNINFEGKNLKLRRVL